MEFAPSLDIVLKETLVAVKEIKDKGLCKFIGITGYPLDNFRTIIERSTVPIDTILTYCRYSLNDTSLLSLLDFLVERGIGIVNASPISMGLLSNRGPPSWHPATEEIQVRIHVLCLEGLTCWRFRISCFFVRGHQVYCSSYHDDTRIWSSCNFFHVSLSIYYAWNQLCVTYISCRINYN